MMVFSELGTYGELEILILSSLLPLASPKNKAMNLLIIIFYNYLFEAHQHTESSETVAMGNAHLLKT